MASISCGRRNTEPSKLIWIRTDPFCVNRSFSFCCAISFSFVLFASMNGLAWEGPEDNKPANDLQAMDDPTLA